MDGVAYRPSLPAPLRRLWSAWLDRIGGTALGATRSVWAAFVGDSQAAFDLSHDPSQDVPPPEQLGATAPTPTGGAAARSRLRVAPEAIEESARGRRPNPSGAPPWLICDDCLRSLTLLRAPLCERCGAPTAWPVARCGECCRPPPRVHVCPGSGCLRECARAGSSARGRSAASASWHPWPPTSSRQSCAAPVADVITCIPPDGDRSLRRGRQPAADLADELAVRWHVDVAPLLTRTRAVTQQTGLTRSERRRNVSGAFAASGSLSPGEHRTVLLVDDVYTTGATVGAASSALRAAGVRTVHVVTFARAIRGSSASGATHPGRRTTARGTSAKAACPAPRS